MLPALRIAPLLKTLIAATAVVGVLVSSPVAQASPTSGISAKKLSFKNGFKRKVTSNKQKRSSVAFNKTPKKSKKALAAAATVGAVGASAAATERDEAIHLFASPGLPRLQAQSFLAIDLSSNEVLAKKNDDDVLPIASLTKLMTGLLVAEAKLDLDEVITITQEDTDSIRGTGSRMPVGAKLTRGEAMHLALMSSENRAAHALGRTFPGGLNEFVKRMNAKAAALGMRDTRYVEPTGLSSDNRSTARDLALLAVAAYQHPLMRDLSTSVEYNLSLGQRSLHYKNSNRLVHAGWDIGLQKTGFIREAGRCLVMHTQVAGKPTVMVFLNSPSASSRVTDAVKLRGWLEHQTSTTAANHARSGSRS